uniref:S8 family serine peptidase n=1 Tax=Anaerosporobacter sp. TaxID=1872529 RepID=UPI00286F6072
MRKRWLAVAMATTLMFTSIVPSQYLQAALNTDYAKSERGVSKGATQKQTLSKNPLEENSYQEDDEVTIIVELEENSLLERFDSAAGNYQTRTYYTDAETYLDSDEAQLSSEQMIEKQNQVVKSINKKIRTSSNDVLYHYTTVMNGFAIKAKYGQLDEIKKMPEVKTAYVARTYEVVEPNMTTSNQMIDSGVAHDLDYNGEGMVVAILDTGLDTSHEAFSADTLSVDALANLKITESMVSQEVTANNVAAGRYVSDKIPFAYDYADDDSEVTPSKVGVELYGNSHGTHVAGTVAGNSSTI